MHSFHFSICRFPSPRFPCPSVSFSPLQLPTTRTLFQWNLFPTVEARLSGLWIPAVEHQADMGKFKLDLPEMHDWQKSNDLELVGICLVVPEGNKEDAKQLHVFTELEASFQASCPDQPFLFALTGNDRMSCCYTKGAGTMLPLEIKVHWTGPESLYRVKSLANELQIEKEVMEAAKKSWEEQRIKPIKKRKQIEAERNAQRRARSGEELSELESTTLSNLKVAITELKEISDFLVARLTDFAEPGHPTIADFSDFVKKRSMAKLEMSKLQLQEATDLMSAGRFMSGVLELKSLLEQRVLKRQANQSHTYNGNKWLRKRFGSSSVSSKASSYVSSRAGSYGLTEDSAPDTPGNADECIPIQD